MKIKHYLIIATLVLTLGLLGSARAPQETPSTNVSQITKKHQIREEPLDPNLLRHPTIEEIFDDQVKDLSSRDDEKLVTLIATGDVIPARTVNFKMSKYNNFKYPVEKTANILKEADITLINLEAPLIKNCPLTNTGMIFCGDQRFVEGLLFAGVDVANLTNNHLGNYGQDGINQTQELLNNNGIITTGLGEATFKRVGETTFAFLGYNGVFPKAPGLSWIEKEKSSKEIRKAKDLADVVVVSFHWGQEYTEMPKSAGSVSPFDPKGIAHFAIDSGADLIIGNHPHWIQGIEFYKGKLITYAHGNFIFDQMWSQETRKGVLGKYTFYEKKLIEVEVIPVIINDYAQPQIPEEEAKREILNNMLTLSNNLAR